MARSTKDQIKVDKDICYRHQKTLKEVRQLNLCPSSCILGTWYESGEGLTVCAHLSSQKKLQELLDNGECRRWLHTLTIFDYIDELEKRANNETHNSKRENDRTDLGKKWRDDRAKGSPKGRTSRVASTGSS